MYSLHDKRIIIVAISITVRQKKNENYNLKKIKTN